MDTVKEAVDLAKAPRLAWLGLGNMGRGMVKNIVEKGTYTSPLLIYNRTTARAEKLAATLPSEKVKVVTKIEDAVEGADVVFICVGDDKAVEETISTALKAPSAGQKLFVDCSTIHPDTTDKIAKTINSTGAQFVACPVFGAQAMADAGQLVCVLAGPKTQIDRIRPYCKGVMAKAEIDFSDQSHGTATRLKIIGNTFILNMVECLSEGHVLAEKSGLGSENLHQFIEAVFGPPYVAYSKRMMTGDYHTREEPPFAVDLAIKDASHALDLAKTHDTKLPDVDVALGHLRDVKSHVGERGDIAGIYGAVRKDAGLKFEL